MLIVGCQSCGEAKILAGTPDKDGVARMNWSCPRCGAGQVLQLEVAGRVRMNDLHSILGGLALSENPAGGTVAEFHRVRPGELGSDM
ncbi:MAG: alcohol dehydrogenase [Synergistaceae bacterium]|jgi:ribosomal protein S27AE|nr:alcohol dehydrogenase [Synergistaceae bacterium]